MKMKFNEYTIPASGECVFRIKSLADQTFKAMGFNGETKLCRVDNLQRAQVVWANISSKRIVYLPVFFGDFALEPPEVDEIVPIEKTFFLYRERDDKFGAYYIVLFYDDEILFYQIRMLPNHLLVEKYCEARGLNVTHISICKLMTIKDNKYVLTCWAVEHEEPDDRGCPIRYSTLIPVDFAESEKLRDASLSKLNEEYLHENDVFVAQKTIYRVLKDEEGKYYISKELFPRPKEKTREVIRMKNDEAEKRICKIVPLRQH